MRVFLTANNDMHNQLLNAFQNKAAIVIDEDYKTHRGHWNNFRTKLAVLLELGSDYDQEALLRFVVDVLPNGAYSKPAHEFWGSQAALDVEEILDGRLDLYTPAGWAYGSFPTSKVWESAPIMEYGWFRPGAHMCRKPKVRNISFVELSNRSVA